MFISLLISFSYFFLLSAKLFFSCTHAFFFFLPFALKVIVRRLRFACSLHCPVLALYICPLRSCVPRSVLLISSLFVVCLSYMLPIDGICPFVPPIHHVIALSAVIFGVQVHYCLFLYHNAVPKPKCRKRFFKNESLLQRDWKGKNRGRENGLASSKGVLREGEKSSRKINGHSRLGAEVVTY